MRFDPCRHSISLPLGALALAALTACGGGSSADGNSPGLSIGGTAAIGAAMAKATVKVQCANGSGSETAGVDGVFSVRITDGKLPCLVQASDGTNTLHSVAEGSGASTVTITANVNPVSELIVAQALGSSNTASAFTAVGTDTALQGKLTASHVQAATSAVQAVLNPVDADIAKTDFLKTAFQPATATRPGDTTDKLIDKVVASLERIHPAALTVQAQVKSFADILVGTNAGASTATALITPAVGNCPAARKAAYRVLDFQGHYGTTNVLDWASPMKTTWNDGSTSEKTIEKHPTDACRLTLTQADSRIDALVSPSGMVIMRDPGPTTASIASIAMAFPLQSFSLADLAGTWNFAAYTKISTWRNSIYEVTIDNNGTATRKNCTGIVDATSCTPSNIGINWQLTAIGDGTAFGITSPSQTDNSTTLFAFRTSKGMVMVQRSSQGGISIGTKQVPLALPAVGASWAYWDVGVGTSASLTSGYTISQVSNVEQTITIVDATTSTFTVKTSKGSTSVRNDSSVVNKPRSGFSYRAAGSYVLNAQTTTYSESLMLPMANMGVAVYLGSGAKADSTNHLGFLVTRP